MIAFSVCALEGHRRARELKDRAVFLSEISALLERFAVGIKCFGRTSDELIEAEGGAFARLVKGFRGDTPSVRAAWERACGTLPKKREETAILRELGRSLGASDTESTLRLLEQCGARIRELQAVAEAEYSKRGKASFQVGTLCGIGAAIIII